jgi:uncharacterized protein DUF4403
MHSHWRKIAIGAAIGVVAIIGAAWAMKWLGLGDQRPALATVPPLAPVTRSSTIVTPVAIALTAIRDALERAAPPDVSGKPDIPALPFLTNLDIGWSVSRSSITVTPRREGLAISTALTGSMRAGGQLSNPAGGLLGSPGDLQDLLGSLFRGNAPPPGRGDQSERTLDQRADIRGSATMIARPVFLPQWRLEPNLTSEVTIADASLSIMGMKLSVPDAVKPLLDRTINEQVSFLQARLRDDPFLELAARQEWAKMCRSVSLGATAPGMPNLWLEVRPTRAFAAQPGLDQTAVLLTIGVQADTRIVPNETKPDCPFPAQLDIVQQMEQGRISIAVPIDIPFTEVNRLMEAQLKGKTFPEDKSSAFTATIRSVNFAASGDRLLISVGLRANETKTWFGFGVDATIHVWGRPMLDRARQVMRLNDIALDVESAAAFGMLGAAARAAVPYLEKALAENAVIDLVPVADSARKNIAAAVADFRKSTDSVRVDAEVVDLRLVDLEFDAKTLRVIAEAEGTVRAAVMKLDDR